MVGGVALALFGARTTGHDACLDRRADDPEVGLGLACDNASRRVADLGAVEIETNRSDERQRVRLAEASVSAAGARCGTVEARVDTAQEPVAIKAVRLGMPLDDLSY
jgi:hypothetical protein